MRLWQKARRDNDTVEWLQDTFTPYQNTHTQTHTHTHMVKNNFAILAPEQYRLGSCIITSVHWPCMIITSLYTLHWYQYNVILHICISFAITNLHNYFLTLLFSYIFSHFVSLSTVAMWQLSSKRNIDWLIELVPKSVDNMTSIHTYSVDPTPFICYHFLYTDRYRTAN